MVVGLNPEAINGRELSTFEYSEAGIISGLLTRAIIQPLDVLKIRFQLQEEPLEQSRGKYHGFIQSIKLIVKEEGANAFWKGHMPAQGLSAVYGLVQFSSFEMLTKKLSTIESLKSYRKLGDFFCGALAGCAAMTSAMPLDVIRTRLVAQGEPKLYRNTMHAARKIWKYEGVPGFFRGIVPSLSQVAPYTGLQFLLYNFFNKYWNKYVGFESAGTLACGSAAGTIAKTILYPLDLVRHRLQVNALIRRGFGRTTTNKGMINTLIKVVKNEGTLGLFKGLWPSMIKAGLNSGCSFLFYELCIDLLRKKMSFDNLPFNFIRDAVDLASVNKPSLLLEWRLINSQWKSVVEAVLSARAWYIQRRRLGFDRLAQSTAFDENSRILRGLETLIIESDTTPQFTENVDEIFVGDLAFTKKFVESPQDELNKKVVFVHGCGGNGTTFFLNSMGRYFSKFDYNVLFIDGSIYNVLPNLDCLEESIEVLRQKSKAILIIDDSDKLLLDHMRGVSEWNASVDWCLQKDKLTALIESLQSADIRIILASNGCSLMTEELGK
ncbi:Mitochondrial thiamine pyrophosphate carrier [Aphelenchoides bicaudatus]|nr:Mitochondrial thiamine pyrophosphate carrier [Aphelenchoides bicaudatus]